MHLRSCPGFPEKGLNRDLAEFNTDDRVTLFTEPQQVEAFSAQGDQYPAALRQPQLRPVAQQVGIDLVLMETGLIGLPAFQPEVGIYNGTPSRESAVVAKLPAMAVFLRYYNEIRVARDGNE
jgi:hypothetical protein